jgi:phytoene dehydrogenase-like protein
MDILYGIDNPLFLDLKNDKEYLFKTILPWLFKYIITIKKISNFNAPIEKHLQKFTENRSLIDMIAQHFFRATPAFFALSYFSLYLDYKYPVGGTGIVTEKMEKFILDNNGEIKKETEICHIDPQKKQVKDLKGNKYNYRKLIWAADLKTLYNIMDINSLRNSKLRQRVTAVKQNLSDKIGGDSVLTVYLTIDMDKKYFENIFPGHFFYTPVKDGISKLKPGIFEKKSSASGNISFTNDKESILNWIKKYYELTTYEISCPVIHDINLAPEGKTGLIISTLIDYFLVKHISGMGWYDEFKKVSSQCIINVLANTVFPGIKTKIMDQFVSTPLTLEKLTSNLHGAITGWAFTNDSMPAVNSLPKIAKSVLTPVPDIFQAGQWTFSPSGLPISVLTGKLAADKARKNLKKETGR